MPPEILTAALRYKADLARRETAMMRDLAGHYVRVIRGLEDEIAALARIMAARRARGLEVTAGYLYRTERYQQLLAQSYAQFVRFESAAADLITANQATFARLGREYGLGLLDVLEPGLGGGFNRLAVGAIENIAGFVADGSPLRALLADAWPGVIDQTTSALVKGVALGYNPRKIARMMSDAIGGGLNRSLVIARTETQRAHRQARMDTWRETGLVRGWQRVATHDRRTCSACLFDEGRFYPIDEDMPEHPQGRCVALPVLRNQELHKWEYGAEWFERQPPSTQIDILGPGRLAAWHAGQFDLRDVPSVEVNPIWGPSMRARGLAELVGAPRGAR